MIVETDVTKDCCAAPHIEGAHIAALLQAIGSADICVFYQTTDLTYLWAENLPPFLEDRWHNSCRDADFLDLHIAENMETVKLQVLATGLRQSIEVRFDNNGHPLWYRFCIDCHRDAKGQVLGLIMTGVNISEIRCREQVLKVLLREVTHRSKNLLAIIQSIATQTARYSDGIRSFLKKFQGRIQSLSHSQDLVTESNWHGAGFRELLKAQAEGYLGGESSRLQITGLDPYLFPKTTLYMGLAFHELIINSLSFGALSQEAGDIVVKCAREKDEKECPILVISWHENLSCQESLSFPELGEGQSQSRFGSVVLEKIVPASVGGTAYYEMTPQRVLYKISVPQEEFTLSF